MNFKDMMNKAKEATAEIAAKANEMAAKAKERQAVMYLSGPFDLKANTLCSLVLKPDELILQSESAFGGGKEVCRIPYSRVVEVTVDTAERFTLTRALLVGVFAFGFKKKDKLLKLDFIDEVGTQSDAVFGKGPMTDCDQIRGLVLTAKRECLKRQQQTAQPQPVTASVATPMPPPPPSAKPPPSPPPPQQSPQKFHVSVNQVQKGPFTLEQIQAMLAAGEVSTKDFIWYDGLPEWKPISEFVE